MFLFGVPRPFSFWAVVTPDYTCSFGWLDDDKSPSQPKLAHFRAPTLLFLGLFFLTSSFHPLILTPTILP